MAWLTQWWTLLATLLVVFVPGLIAAWSIGLRRLGAWAFAPVGSIAMITLVAVAYGAVGIRWNVVTAVIGLMVVSAVLVAIRLIARIAPRGTTPSGASWPVLMGLVGGGALVAARFVLYIGNPSNVSQSNDAPFHLGAVRAIIDHGNASSFGLAGLVDPQATGMFYPGGWHSTTSLMVMLGAEIPEATNIFSIVVAALVWPAGVAWLTQIITGRRVAAAIAAALSPTLLAFPLLLIQYGILYSYLLGVALVPAAIAVVVCLARRQAAYRWAAIALATLMVLGALGASQPSVILVWALVLWLCGVGRAIGVWRGSDAPRHARMVVLIAAVAGLLALILVWSAMMSFVTADYWGPVRSPREAVVDIASSGYAGTPAVWWVSLLIVIGAAVVLIGRGRWAGMRWVAWSGLAFVVLYGVAAVVRSEWLRLPLVGPWYSDTYRLAALVPLLAIPLASIGAVWLVDAAVDAVRQRRARVTGTPRESIAAQWGVTAVALFTVSVVFFVQPIVQRYHVANGMREEISRFAITDQSWLSIAERTLLSRLSQEVPGDERVLANPGTGAAFGYALTGVDVFPAKWQVPREEAYGYLAESLHEAETWAPVCEAVSDLGARYVLDFGLGDGGTGHVKMPGFTGLEGVPGFDLVDSEGEAKLWRITACL